MHSDRYPYHEQEVAQLVRENRSATIDFTGTSQQLNSNFNAPKAVTQAAVLYVFRTLIDDNIPLNAGDVFVIETPGGGGFGKVS